MRLEQQLTPEVQGLLTRLACPNSRFSLHMQHHTNLEAIWFELRRDSREQNHYEKKRQIGLAELLGLVPRMVNADRCAAAIYTPTLSMIVATNVLRFCGCNSQPVAPGRSFSSLIGTVTRTVVPVAVESISSCPPINFTRSRMLGIPTPN
jgi:hypothetical protein